MMKPLLGLLMLIPLLLKNCVNTPTDENRVLLAEVGSELVYLDEALLGMPAGLSAKDSAFYVKQFVRNRAKELLVYEKAVKNIPESQEMEDLVENYKRSLVIYEYQQQVLNEKMQTGISEVELKDFYQANSRRFVAEHSLIKGVFIKIPKNATDLDKLKRLYKDSTDDSFAKIEKICVQNAGQFEFFYDKWVSFDDIMDKIPYSVTDKSDFLRNRSTLEVVESDFCYLLYIDDYVLSGNTAPFEYVRANVMNVMINTKKTEFIHQFEATLLKDAERKGKIKYYKQ